MIGIDCLCFVTPKGDLVGAPHVGVSKVAKSGKGCFLLDHQVRTGAKVKVSALPDGWVHDWRNTEQGLLVRVFDRSARPADHGFALVIESPPTPETLPVPAFSTSVRGELGPGDVAPAPDTTADVTAAAVVDVTETPASTDDEEAPITSASTKRRGR